MSFLFLFSGKTARQLVFLILSSISVNALAVDIDQYPVLQKLVDTMSSEDSYPKDELVEVLKSASIDENTLALMDRQYEALPWFKYRKLFINRNRIDMGVEFWNTHAPVLKKAYKKYGVPPSVIVALIGIETHYGTRIGNKSVLDSLVTLSAAYPRRSRFFTGELRTFLNTTRKEKVPPEDVLGSFAGAIGIPQFMPTSYEAYAVDFNDNGQRDLVNEIDDAIGSIANYLTVHGWNRGQKIYSSVARLPESAIPMVSRKSKLVHNTSGLTDAGIDFDAAEGSSKSALISLQEENGKRYIVGYRNFYAVTRYNPSTNYAMAVVELSEAIQSKHDL